MKKAKVVLIWIIGIMFIATGISKVLNLDPMSASMFSKANFPFWLFYIAAAFEFFGGILFINTSTRKTGSAMLAAVMVGAICTHLYLKDNIAHIIVPVMIIIIMALNFKRK